METKTKELIETVIEEKSEQIPEVMLEEVTVVPLYRKNLMKS